MSLSFTRFFLAALLALTFVFTGAAAIAADEAPPPKQPGSVEEISIGTIGEVDLGNNTFVLKLADGKKVNVTFNEETKFTQDGKDADKAALKAGERAVVTHKAGAASMIELRA